MCLRVDASAASRGVVCGCCVRGSACRVIARAAMWGFAWLHLARGGLVGVAQQCCCLPCIAAPSAGAHGWGPETHPQKTPSRSPRRVQARARAVLSFLRIVRAMRSFVVAQLLRARRDTWQRPRRRSPVGLRVRTQQAASEHYNEVLERSSEGTRHKTGLNPPN